MIGEIKIERDGVDIFVVDGLRIAKRGPKEWISLEVGWSVTDCIDGDGWEIEVSFEGGEAIECVGFEPAPFRRPLAGNASNPVCDAL